MNIGGVSGGDCRLLLVQRHERWYQWLRSNETAGGNVPRYQRRQGAASQEGKRQTSILWVEEIELRQDTTTHRSQYKLGSNQTLQRCAISEVVLQVLTRLYLTSKDGREESSNSPSNLAKFSASDSISDPGFKSEPTSSDTSIEYQRITRDVVAMIYRFKLGTTLIQHIVWTAAEDCHPRPGIQPYHALSSRPPIQRGTSFEFCGTLERPWLPDTYLEGRLEKRDVAIRVISALGR